MRSDISQRLDAVEQDRIELQLEIDRNSRRVEHALSQQRPEVARRLDILLVAGEGEFRRDVEGRRGIKVGHVKSQVTDVNRRHLLAQIVEVDGAVLDAERLDRQFAKRGSLMRAPALRVGVRPDRAHIQIAARVHHKADVRFNQIEFRNLRLAAQQRDELDVHRHVIGREKRLGRECRIVGNRETAHFGRHAPSELRLNLTDLDVAAECVAHARDDSILVAGDDRTQIEVRVGGEPGRDQHDRGNCDAGDDQ